MVVYYLADMTLRKDVLGGQINKHIRCPKAYILFRYLLRIFVIVDYIIRHKYYSANLYSKVYIFCM